MLKLVPRIASDDAADPLAPSGNITRYDRKALFRSVLLGPRVLLIACTQACAGGDLVFRLLHGGLRCLRLAATEVPAAAAAGQEFLQSMTTALARDVTDLVVCGHSSCGLLRERVVGAAGAAVGPGAAPEDFMQRVIRKRRAADALLQHVQRHVVAQLRTLQSYPAVAQARERNGLRLHAWVYLDCSGMILRHDPRTDLFVPLTENIACF